MEDKKRRSSFFPKGVTSLVVYRALFKGVNGFADISDYLRIVGKEMTCIALEYRENRMPTLDIAPCVLSRESYRKRPYRQRRNSVVKYSINKLKGYGLATKGNLQGTYSPVENYAKYLEFLNENANILYERIKFYISFSINEMFRELSERRRFIASRFLFSEGIADEALKKKLREKWYTVIGPSISKSGLVGLVMDSYDDEVFEPYKEDAEHIEMLKSLFKSVNFNDRDIRKAMYDIVFNERKQAAWLDEEISKYFNVSGKRSIVSLAEERASINKLINERTNSNIYLKIPSKQYRQEVEKQIENGDGFYHKWDKGTNKPWWLIQFKRKLEIENKKILEEVNIITGNQWKPKVLLF